MNWDNFYVKFAVVFITLVTFFAGSYYYLSPIQNCKRKIDTWYETSVPEDKNHKLYVMEQKKCDRLSW
jgi:hypothetical protein